MADTGHYSIDSTTVRAHVSAAGGKGGLIDALLAAHGAGSPVNFTVWLNAHGQPHAFHLTGGEAADCKAYDALNDLPVRAPDALLVDKGYDADAISADLAKRNIEDAIPGRSNRRVKIEHDRAIYKQRNRIERMFGHLKINRAITCWDQTPKTSAGNMPRPPAGRQQRSMPCT